MKEQRYTLTPEGRFPITPEEASLEIKREEEQEAEFLKTSYIRNRQAEYPPITDYIDAVVKGDKEQMDKYIAECMAVKVKYPKP